MTRRIWLAALLVAAACGGDDSYQVPPHPDARPVDAGPDARPIDSPRVDGAPDSPPDARPDAAPDAMIDAPPGQLFFMPPSLDFGVVYPTGATRTITLVNPRIVTVGVSTAISSGFHAAVNNCEPVIGPSASCDIVIALDGTTGGPYTGTITVQTSGANPETVTANLTATLGMQVTVAAQGVGTGTVTSSPAGIACPGACEQDFATGVTLMATPADGSKLVDWNYAGCPTPASGIAPLTCTIPFSATAVALAPDFEISDDSVTQINFAVTAPGEVAVRDVNGQLVATCTSSCTVHSTAGVGLILYGSTSQVFGGFSGDCTSTAGTAYCSLNATAGAHAVTATFNADSRVVFTRTSTAAFTAVGFDAAGNLYAATATSLYQYSSTGTLNWTQPIAGVVGIVPRTTVGVNVIAGNTLRALDGSGTAIWSTQLDTTVQGCAVATRFPRCLAVSPDGTLAVSGPHGFGRYSNLGAFVWKKGQDSSLYAIAIDATDDIYVADAYTDGPQLDVRRFTGTAGTEVFGGTVALPTPWLVDAGYAVGGLGLSPNPRLWIASADASAAASTLSSYALDASPFTTSVQPIANGATTPKPAVALTATGGAWYVPSVDTGTACTFTLLTLAGSTIGNADSRVALDANAPLVPEGFFGFAPNDMAVNSAGQIALAGAYNGATLNGGVLQVFAP